MALDGDYTYYTQERQADIASQGLLSLYRSHGLHFAKVHPEQSSRRLQAAVAQDSPFAVAAISKQHAYTSMMDAARKAPGRRRNFSALGNPGVYAFLASPSYVTSDE